MATELTASELKARLKALGLFGLIACCDEIIDKTCCVKYSPSKSGSAKNVASSGAHATRTSGPPCSKKGGSLGVYGITGGTVYNASTTDFLRVTCPIVRDRTQISTGSDVNVFDRHTIDDVTCTLVTQYTTSTGGILSFTDSATSAGFSSGPQVLPLGAVGVPGAPYYYYAECDIPPMQSGNASHLISLYINEYYL